MGEDSGEREHAPGERRWPVDVDAHAHSRSREWWDCGKLWDGARVRAGARALDGRGAGGQSRMKGRRGVGDGWEKREVESRSNSAAEFMRQ